jgi:hypothetical protein
VTYEYEKNPEFSYLILQVLVEVVDFISDRSPRIFTVLKLIIKQQVHDVCSSLSLARKSKFG